MAFRVEIVPVAMAEAEAAYAYIARDSPANAAAWWNGLVELVRSLAVFPRRFPDAPERTLFDEDVRHALHGGYRVIFAVDDDRVRVLHIRHAARLPITEEGGE